MHTDTRAEVGTPPQLAVGLGAACVVAGASLNPWVMAWVAPDGDIESAAIRGAILAVDGVLIAVGAALLVFRPSIRARDLGMLIASLLFGLVGLEGMVRLGVGSEPLSGTLELDETLGWRPKPEYERVIEDDPVYGTVRYSTVRDGFRRYGSLPEASGPGGRVRVLFLGDSGTQANQVSDGKPYYDVVARDRPELDVYAFGAGGYGTLQEYMVLDRHTDEIRPDVVVIQLSPNDVMNNSFALESRSAFNSRMMRPYLEDGEVVRRFPSRSPLVRYSRAGRLIAARLDFLGYENDRFRRRSVEYRIDESRELWDAALEATVEIFRLFRERVGDVPVVAFETSPSYLEEENVFARLAERAGIAFMEGVPAALDSAVAAGAVVDFSPYDGHWNETGHAIAAAVVTAGLEEMELIPRRGRSDDGR